MVVSRTRNLNISKNKDVLNSRWAGYAPIIEAQAKHESRNFTSDLARKYNNIFGMGSPSNRETLDTGKGPVVEGQKMASFDSKRDAVKDFLLYLNEFDFPTSFKSLEGYIAKMKQNGYFKDSVRNYNRGVKSFLKSA